MYRIIIVLITFLLFISCQKNCDEEIKNLTEQYQKALFNTGGSSTAVIKLTDDYNKKLAELNKRCN